MADSSGNSTTGQYIHRIQMDSNSVKKVHLIINPASGKAYPILWVANQFFKAAGLAWTISITQKKGDAKKQAIQAIKKKVDAVLVYGGDGTVMEVAKALINTTVPLSIIPGGTANVLAKELAIPIDPKQALEVITSPERKTIRIDTFLCNGRKYVIRANTGLFASIVVKAHRQVKQDYGILAYTLPSLTDILNPEPIKYSLTVDGKQMTMSAIACMVTNSGNIGLSGMSWNQSIKMTDGLLDVVFIENTDIATIASIAKSSLLKHTHSPAITHLSGKNITLTMKPRQTVILDDIRMEANTLTLAIQPTSLSVLVTKKPV